MLPQASSLCGACREVCPIKINIPRMLLELRHRTAESEDPQENASPRSERFMAGMFARLMRSPGRMGFAARKWAGSRRNCCRDAQEPRMDPQGATSDAVQVDAGAGPADAAGKVVQGSLAGGTEAGRKRSWPQLTPAECPERTKADFLRSVREALGRPGGASPGAVSPAGGDPRRPGGTGLAELDARLRENRPQLLDRLADMAGRGGWNVHRVAGVEAALGCVDSPGRGTRHDEGGPLRAAGLRRSAGGYGAPVAGR